MRRGGSCSQSCGTGTVVARGKGGTPRSVVGPDECPRFHCLHLRLLPVTHFPPKLPGCEREVRVGKCSSPAIGPAHAAETRCNGLQRQSGVARARGAADGSQLVRATSRMVLAGPPGCGGEPQFWRTCSFASSLEPALPGNPGVSPGLSVNDKTFHCFLLFSLFLLLMEPVMRVFL